MYFVFFVKVKFSLTGSDAVTYKYQDREVTISQIGTWVNHLRLIGYILKDEQFLIMEITFRSSV